MRAKSEWNPTLLEECQKCIDFVPEMHALVFSWCCGLNSPPQTHEKVSVALNLKPKVVQRIEHSLLQQMSAEMGIKQRLRTALEETLQNRVSPLSMADICFAHPYFVGDDRVRYVIPYLIDAWRYPGIYNIEIDGIMFLARIDQWTWNLAVRHAQDIVSQCLRQGVPASRCRSLVGRLLQTSACEFDTPLWLQAIGEDWIEDFNLSRKVGLRRGDPKSHWLHSKWLRFPMFGVSLQEGTRSVAEVVGMAQVEHMTLESQLAGFLATLEDRPKEVFIQRSGYEGSPLTLQALGDRLGVSRERVRQIENRVLKGLVDETQIRRDLANALEEALEGRLAPLPLAGITSASRYFVGCQSSWRVVEYLIKQLSITGMHVITINTIPYLSHMDERTWKIALRSAEAVVATAADHDLSAAECEAAIYNLLPVSAQEFSSTLWLYATRYSHFLVGNDGQRRLVADGRGAESFVEAVLTASDSPLHYTEIAKRIEVDWDRPIDVRRAHNAAAEIGILFGRGTYGLKHHLQISEAHLAELAEKALAVVGSAMTTRQWHTTEILESLAENDELPAEGVDPYVLDYALHCAGKLKDLGRMIWTADESTTSNTAERMNLHQSIVRVLEMAGGPLESNEIMTRVNLDRGTSAFFQIFQREPLVRLGNGKWGLNDRDVGIKRTEQMALLNRLMCVLDERQTALHASEIAYAIRMTPQQELEADALCSIAASDPRFSLGRGRLLYPSCWSGPNRPTTMQALRSVLAERPEGLLVGEIVDRLELALERPISRVQVAGALRAIGAQFDIDTGGWKISDDEPDETDF